MQTRRACDFARVQRTVRGVKHPEHVCRANDRTDWLSQRADLRDLRRPGVCGRSRPALTEGSNLPGHGSSAPGARPDFERSLYANNMLHTSSDRVNQEQLSSIEDNSAHALLGAHALRVNHHRSGTPPNLKEIFDLSARLFGGWSPDRPRLGSHQAVVFYRTATPAESGTRPSRPREGRRYTL